MQFVRDNYAFFLKTYCIHEEPKPMCVSMCTSVCVCVVNKSGSEKY